MPTGGLAVKAQKDKTMYDSKTGKNAEGDRGDPAEAEGKLSG